MRAAPWSLGRPSRAGLVLGYPRALKGPQIAMQHDAQGPPCRTLTYATIPIYPPRG